MICLLCITSYVLNFQAYDLQVSDLNIKQIIHAYVAMLGMVLVKKLDTFCLTKPILLSTHCAVVLYFVIITYDCDITDLVVTTLLFIGFSLITDMVVMNIDSDEVESSHKEILMISQYRTADMQKLVKAILSKIITSP